MYIHYTFNYVYIIIIINESLYLICINCISNDNNYKYLISSQCIHRIFQ